MMDAWNQPDVDVSIARAFGLADDEYLTILQKLGMIPGTKDFGSVIGMATGVPKVHSALTAEAPVAPAGGTGMAVGGWSTAGNRTLAIATIIINRARIANIETTLQRLGHLPGT